MELLVCPDCHGTLKAGDTERLCVECQRSYPVVGGVPVLLFSGSTFTAEQISRSEATYYADKLTEGNRKRKWRQRLPALVHGWDGHKMAAAVASALQDRSGLVGLEVGAGERPGGTAARFPQVDTWVVSDVDAGWGVGVVADVCGIPLPDQSVDVVVAGNVLEHVYDIHQAAREIDRVLRPDGIVVVDVPFMYPFHGVPYDYARVTPSGVRALFPSTEIVYIGRGSGQWSAVAVALHAAIVDSFKGRQARRAAMVASRLVLWPLKHLDRFGPGRLDSATAVAYVGRKDRARTPAEIVDELRARFS